jgi:hypothetical protein
MLDRQPLYPLDENRRTTRAIHDWAQRWASARPMSDDMPVGTWNNVQKQAGLKDGDL